MRQGFEYIHSLSVKLKSRISGKTHLKLIPHPTHLHLYDFDSSIEFLDIKVHYNRNCKKNAFRKKVMILTNLINFDRFSRKVLQTQVLIVCVTGNEAGSANFIVTRLYFLKVLSLFKE